MNTKRQQENQRNFNEGKVCFACAMLHTNAIEPTQFVIAKMFEFGVFSNLCCLFERESVCFQVDVFYRFPFVPTRNYRGARLHLAANVEWLEIHSKCFHSV